jgi:hypothetical protein
MVRQTASGTLRVQRIFAINRWMRVTCLHAAGGATTGRTSRGCRCRRSSRSSCSRCSSRARPCTTRRRRSLAETDTIGSWSRAQAGGCARCTSQRYAGRPRRAGLHECYDKHETGRAEEFRVLMPGGVDGEQRFTSQSVLCLFQVERMMGFEVNFTGPPVRARSWAN